MKTKIIIDSTANIKKNLAEKLGIVPLTVHFGEESYADGIEIDNTGFYEKLVTSEVLPTTSQPTPDAFAKAMQKATDAGQEAVVITVASKLSGTYQSANIAAADFGGKVHVVDSETVAIGAGILAEYALQLADEGKGAAEIARIINEEKKRVKLLAVLDTLEYLKKGGRVSKTVAFAGGLLSVKPVALIEDGEIKIAGKARGNKQGNAIMNQNIENLGGIDFGKPFLLGYTGVSDELLQSYISENQAVFQGNEINISQVGSVVGTHAGPGAIAAAFFLK